MRLTAIALMTAGLATGIPALAQDAPKPKTDADLIANAKSAAPAAVAKDATIVVVEADGKLRTLQPGQGAFTCLPDDPNTPGHDPVCLDRNGVEWLKSLLTRGKPPEGKIWLGYMLQGGSDASVDDPFATEPPQGKKWVQTGPHVIIGGPGITKMLEGYSRSAEDAHKPYIMFSGTPYEYLILPVQ